MPVNPKYHAIFYENRYYHVYNRTVGKEKLFTIQENYRYFLQKIDEFLLDYVEIYAYCLLGNHFHLLIRIKCKEELSEDIREKANLFETTNDCIIKRFNDFFVAYVLAFNEQESRHGGLFCKRFKRIWVDNEDYYTRLVYYIHNNPVKHSIWNDYTTYQWSSYGRILTNVPSKLRKDDILMWFGGKEKFIESHKQAPKNMWEIFDYYLE